MNKEYIHSFQVTPNGSLITVWSYNEENTAHNRYILSLVPLQNPCLSQIALKILNTGSLNRKYLNSQLEPIIYKKFSSICNIIRTKIIYQNNQKLVVYRTLDDGDCAFHALLGIPDGNIVLCRAARAMRNFFCNWLTIYHTEIALTSHICLILQDYFLNIQDAPSVFRKLVKSAYDTYQHDYLNLSKIEQEQRLENFSTDPLVRNCYIENLRQPSTYLLQPELELVGRCFDKKIQLYQPEWGCKNNKSCYGITEFNSEADDTVILYFKDNHYERAEVVPITDSEDILGTSLL